MPNDTVTSCQLPGIHGPTPCGPVLNHEDECACGCTAYEEACPYYETWFKEHGGEG